MSSLRARFLRRSLLAATICLGFSQSHSTASAQPVPPMPAPQATQPPIVVTPPDTNTPPAPTTNAPGEYPNGYFDQGNNQQSGAPGEANGYIPLSNQNFSGTSGSIMPGAESATRGLGMSILEMPSHATIIGPQQLSEKNASDTARALQNEVGVLVQSTAKGQASPFIRGLTGQQTVILVDGVRLNNSTYRAGPNQYFNTIDPGLIDHIEVIRGPQSILWGSDAIGGAINVVTKSPDRSSNYSQRQFTEIFSTADMGTYTRMSGETWNNTSGIYGGASYLNVNDLDIGGDRGKQPFTDYDQYAGDVKYQKLLSPDSIFTVSLQHFEQQDLPRSDRFAPFTSSPRPTFFDPQQRDMINARIDGLAWNEMFDAYSVTFNYSRQKEGVNETRLNPDSSINRVEFGEFDVNTFGTVLTLVKDLDWAGKLSYGADYYYDDVDSFRVRTAGNAGVPIVPPSVQPSQFPNDSLYDRAGVYSAWDIPLTDRLSALAGVRYENANAQGTTRIGADSIFIERTYQDWIASLGLNYKCTEELHLVGGYYEGYRAPNLDDLYADSSFLQGQFQTISSVNVGPEYSQTYEVGFKYDGPALRLQAFQYWNDFQQAILRHPVNAATGLYDPASSTVTRDNSDAYIYGTEVGGELLLDDWLERDGWSLYGNVWYTYGVDLGTNDLGAPSEPYSRIPPLQGTLGTRWRAPEGRRWFDVYVWMVDRADRYAFLNKSDARFIVNGNPYTPGYATLNLRTGRTFGEFDQHRLSVGLENITDKYYRVLGSGVEGAGINAILGYEYTF